MRFRLFCFGMLLALGVTAGHTCHAVTLQPTGDAFVYQFLPTFNFDSGSFGSILSAGNTGIGHDTESLLQFDVSSLGLSAAQVSSAQIKLYAVSASAAGFGNDPTAATPIQLDLTAANGSWSAGAVTWSTLPSTIGSPVSASENGINQWITFDVTNLVKAWLNGSLTNNGVLLTQHAPVLLNPNDSGSLEVGVYDSSQATSNGPVLIVNTVPEPSSCALALFGTMAVGCSGVLRRSARRKLLVALGT